MSSLSSYLATACLLLGLLGCERETRDIQVEPTQANRPRGTPMTELVPGRPTVMPRLVSEYDENAFALAEGKRLYSAFNCVGCHAHGGGGMGPPLMDDTWIYGHEPAQILATIVEGRPNGMPSFGGRIARYQVSQLVAYVRSMAGLVPKTAAPGRNDDMQTRPPENSTDRQEPRASTPPAATTSGGD